MPDSSTNKQVSFQLVLNALLDENNLFPPTYLHRFSDLTPDELIELQRIWLHVDPIRRVTLMQDLEDLAESDTLVIFDAISRLGLSDPEPEVRATAIRMLWEDQDTKLVPSFIDMMENDNDAQVRAAAASALGLFIYLGELEEIPQATLHNVEDALLRVTASSDQPVVRRRALEALGYSSRKEVPLLIQTGFNAGENEWLSSALFAMGRSADPRWEAQILQVLNHPDAPVQMEAVRAAGQLELASARETLLEMLGQAEQLDVDVFAAAVWSLSQIGGESVRNALEQLLEETEDEDDIEYIETALENLTFTEEFGNFNMFDFEGSNEEDSMKEIDLSETDENPGSPSGDGKEKTK